jgi:DNA (cytosine-5)-methyltransferase 1
VLDTAKSRLVLSVFPGIGLLDRAFEESSFCVVRGPDLVWGGDVRTFHPPAGAFEGVIGGPPCQVFSPLIRIRGSRSINLIPEFERVVHEAAPTWFLMENVRNAPIPEISGYTVRNYLFDNRWAGGAQQRRRRFSFGSLEGWKLTLETCALENPKRVRCVLASDGKRNGNGIDAYRPDCSHTISAQHLSIEDTLEAQGLPRGYLDHCPFTKDGKYRAVGNGVPLPMGRVFARAISQLQLLEVGA